MLCFKDNTCSGNSKRCEGIVCLRLWIDMDEWRNSLRYQKEFARWPIFQWIWDGNTFLNRRNWYVFQWRLTRNNYEAWAEVHGYIYLYWYRVQVLVFVLEILFEICDVFFFHLFNFIWGTVLRFDRFDRINFFFQIIWWIGKIA